MDQGMVYDAGAQPQDFSAGKNVHGDQTSSEGELSVGSAPPLGKIVNHPNQGVNIIEKSQPQ